MQMPKKTVAREWLYFLGFMALGLLVLPTPVMLILNPSQAPLGFYKALVDGEEWWVAWAIALSPYLVFQFVRSIRWAVRTTQE